jgi:hypothetical protein
MNGKTENNKWVRIVFDTLMYVNPFVDFFGQLKVSMQPINRPKIKREA